MRVAVLGVGLIGGSIGLAARRYLDSSEVAGYDSDPRVLDAALERGALDRRASSVEDALAGAKACFACAPVGALPSLVTGALAASEPDCVLTDVGSTKRAIARMIDDERFIGGHPVAGSESSGIHAARPDLFQGASWYLTPGPRSSGVLYERLHSILVAFGAWPVAIEAEIHDRLLATVSHLPHVLANVLVAEAARTLSEEHEPLPRIGPSFRDATRVAGANSAIWRDIYTTNADAIANAIDATGARLREVAAVLRAGDPPAIEAWNEAAAADRRRLLETELVGGPARELRVSVPNRPGIIAELALALGRGGVNIQDMALAPAPDNRSGAISFWVIGEEEATRAARLIEELGFPVVEER